MKKLFLNLGFILLGAVVSLCAYSQNDTVKNSNNSSIFNPSDITPPQYVGGEEAMFAFLDSVLVVPQSAIDNNVSGRVIVHFFVDKEGNIKGPSVQQGLTPECNDAAIEAVKKMPLWIPAQQNGKSVNGFASVPISFKTKQLKYDYKPSSEELTYEQYVLTDKKWKLIQLESKDIPESVPHQPYFIITVDKKKRRVLEGNASCADFAARYNWNMKNWKLTFSKIEVSKKKCKGKKVKVIDGDVLSAFKNTKEYRITKEGYLQIGREEKNRFVPLATFESEPLKKKK